MSSDNLLQSRWKRPNIFSSMHGSSDQCNTRIFCRLPVVEQPYVKILIKIHWRTFSPLASKVVTMVVVVSSASIEYSNWPAVQEFIFDTDIWRDVGCHGL
ncbi:unnamed protein product [Allacma fusca]|uniref:Uncharacterized protein n=1 Tax=Allacma fusca TaxID=39272 RepID=A0A8J2KS35_9HEXA|nr:unnamed protein product [Allacma fusca]